MNDFNPDWDTIAPFNERIAELEARIAELEAKRVWVSLTDEERERIWEITSPEYEDRFAFVKAVEAKLKDKNT